MSRCFEKFCLGCFILDRKKKKCSFYSHERENRKGGQRWSPGKLQAGSSLLKALKLIREKACEKCGQSFKILHFSEATVRAGKELFKILNFFPLNGGTRD